MVPEEREGLIDRDRGIPKEKSAATDSTYRLLFAYSPAVPQPGTFLNYDGLRVGVLVISRIQIASTHCTPKKTPCEPPTELSHACSYWGDNKRGWVNLKCVDGDIINGGGELLPNDQIK